LKNSISNKSFKKILFSTKSLQIRDLLFYYQKSENSAISFIINRNKGNAVTRNLFKRRCRSLFNSTFKQKLSNVQIIVRPKSDLKNNYAWKELKLSFEEFYSKLPL
tara:strand:+ start:21324 stop:21641 length:318 start_codon:yes stop_codon:yes gene_type:complete